MEGGVVRCSFCRAHRAWIRIIGETPPSYTSLCERRYFARETAGEKEV